MAYTVVYLDDLPLLISPVEGQYRVSTNADGKKEWRISIYAANGLIEENIGLVPYLHGRKTYIDVDGAQHSVTVSNDMSGDPRAVAAIEITLTEDGYNEESSSGLFDPEITGAVYGNYDDMYHSIPFKAKLSDLTTAYNIVGQFARSITGYLLPPEFTRKYMVYSLTASVDTGSPEFGASPGDEEGHIKDILASLGPGAEITAYFEYRGISGERTLQFLSGILTSPYSLAGLKFTISFEKRNTS
jgi:hypothetical protein